MAYIVNGWKIKKINRERLNLVKSACISDSLRRFEEEKNKKYYEVKKLEKEFIKEKYSLNQSRVDFILKSYLTNSEIPSGSIYNLEKLLEFILKNIYELNE